MGLFGSIQTATYWEAKGQTLRLFRISFGKFPCKLDSRARHLYELNKDYRREPLRQIQLILLRGSEI